MKQTIGTDMVTTRDNYLLQQGNLTRHVFDTFVLATDSAPVLFIVIDRSGKIVSMNKYMLQTLGYTVDEITGKNYLMMLVPDTDKEIAAQNLSMLNFPAHGVFCNKIICKDGREFPVEWSARILTRYDGQPDYVFMLGSKVNRA